YSTLRLAKLQPSAKLKTWDTRAMASKFSPKLPQLVEDLQRLADFLMHGTFGPKVYRDEPGARAECSAG
ncbi:unnamed protein product, partial [Durusdinium trenchii]